jgi:hypothetical protein
MMQPKSDILVLLRNDGLSMDERGKHWSMVIHGEDNKHMIQEEDTASGEFRTLKQPQARMNGWTKYSRLQLVIFIHSLLRVLRHLILWARPMYFRSGPLRVFMSPYVRRKAQLGPVSANPTMVDENPYLSSSYAPTQPSLGLGFYLDEKKEGTWGRTSHPTHVAQFWAVFVCKL